MWAELLPKMVGGILMDDDGPDEPTEIVGYELTDEWVSVTGKDFSFGGQRKYFGITADGPGRLRLHSPLMGAVVTLPAKEAA